MLHHQPLPDDEFSPAWFASQAVNVLVPLEYMIKTDIHRVRNVANLFFLRFALLDDFPAF